MRKPKRPRSVSREEVQRIIDACKGEVTWDDIIETAPGRFRPNAESVARIERRWADLQRERVKLDEKVADIEGEIEELHQKNEVTWYAARLKTTTGHRDE